MTVNSIDSVTKTWVDARTLGINGRGVKRPGQTKTVGGRNVISGEDVSSQADETTKP